MLKKECSNCIFSDSCVELSICDDYYPSTDSIEDLFLKESMLYDYDSYRDEWEEYVSRFYE